MELNNIVIEFIRASVDMASDISKPREVRSKRVDAAQEAYMQWVEDNTAATFGGTPSGT